MDTPLESMDRPIEKKKGIRGKHIAWMAAAIAIILLIYKIGRASCRERV